MTLTFRDALLKVMAQTGISLSRVAEGSGVSYEQLKKVAQIPTRRMNVDDANLVAHFFGITLSEMLEDNLDQDREALVSLWLQLTPQEREILRAAARGRAEPIREA